MPGQDEKAGIRRLEARVPFLAQQLEALSSVFDFPEKKPDISHGRPSVIENTANEDLLFTCPDLGAVNNNGRAQIKSLPMWPHPSIANSTKDTFIYQHK